MGIGWQELVALLILMLVLFGPKRLPEVGRSLGNGIREFRDSMSGNGAVVTEHSAARIDAIEATGTATAAPVEVPAAADAADNGAPRA